MKPKCLLTDDIYDYEYVSQGKTTVASIDDKEKWDCYMLTAGVMACGQVKFISKGRDDQAEIGDKDWAFPEKIATLFGVEKFELFKSFCKPKIKVGAEWVTKGQSCEQATNGVGGIARATFDRIFKWLIIKCNDTLI